MTSPEATERMIKVEPGQGTEEETCSSSRMSLAAMLEGGGVKAPKVVEDLLSPSWSSSSCGKLLLESAAPWKIIVTTGLGGCAA